MIRSEYCEKLGNNIAGREYIKEFLNTDAVELEEIVPVNLLADGPEMYKYRVPDITCPLCGTKGKVRVVVTNYGSLDLDDANELGTRCYSCEEVFHPAQVGVLRKAQKIIEHKCTENDNVISACINEDGEITEYLMGTPIKSDGKIVIGPKDMRILIGKVFHEILNGAEQNIT